jgi:EAL domain-containing protein (putative c-di-GMP-specific phosphodiesterase class I)
VLELTETALMSNEDAGEEFARAVTDLGCGLALDDFGTGFGSLTYLKRLPLSYLKIDREFVGGLVGNEANQHVVRAVVNLARAFGQKTIAEGVENQETLEFLKDVGVDYVQGFHIERPRPFHLSTVAA